MLNHLITHEVNFCEVDKIIIVDLVLNLFYFPKDVLLVVIYFHQIKNIPPVWFQDDYFWFYCSFRAGFKHDNFTCFSNNYLQSYQIQGSFFNYYYWSDIFRLYYMPLLFWYCLLIWNNWVPPYRNTFIGFYSSFDHWKSHVHICLLYSLRRY